MKKMLNCLVIATLLFSFVFTIPAQASSVDYRFLQRYVEYVGADKYDVERGLGGRTYWQEQIDKGLWIGKNRPEKLMGDANIDGKVNAKDALFALNFAVNGNVQTATIASGVKTPFQLGWNSDFGIRYNNGTLSDWGNSPEYWLNYCWYNSPFFADVTKDCVVNSLDALQILKYSVGKAKNFPVGQFNSITIRFQYYPWYTEFASGSFNSFEVINMTEEEFCKKYNYYPDATPTDQ